MYLVLNAYVVMLHFSKIYIIHLRVYANQIGTGFYAISIVLLLPGIRLMASL